MRKIDHEIFFKKFIPGLKPKEGDFKDHTQTRTFIVNRGGTLCLGNKDKVIQLGYRNPGVDLKNNKMC